MAQLYIVCFQTYLVLSKNLSDDLFWIGAQFCLWHGARESNASAGLSLGDGYVAFSMNNMNKSSSARHAKVYQNE